MADTAIVLALVTVSIVAGLAAVSVVLEVPDFFDPCHSWGMDGGVLSPGDDCPSRSATSETKGEAIARLVLIQGTAVVAAVLAFIGARRDGRWFLAAAVAYALLIWPLLLGGAWLLAAFAAVTCGVAAQRSWPRQTQDAV